MAISKPIYNRELITGGLTRIQRYHMERFAHFIRKLADTPVGEGSIPDPALFLYGSNMGNSNAHDNFPLPEIVIGGANGRHQGGRNLELAARTPLANLHLSFLDKFGISTGRIAEL